MIKKTGGEGVQKGWIECLALGERSRRPSFEGTPGRKKRIRKEEPIPVINGFAGKKEGEKITRRDGGPNPAGNLRLKPSNRNMAKEERVSLKEGPGVLPQINRAEERGGQVKIDQGIE